MRYSKDKNIDRLCRELLATGDWRIEIGSKHHKLIHANGMITIPGSPGDPRTWLNFRSEVRRILSNAATQRFRSVAARAGALR